MRHDYQPPSFLHCSIVLLLCPNLVPKRSKVILLPWELLWIWGLLLGTFWLDFFLPRESGDCSFSGSIWRWGLGCLSLWQSHTEEILVHFREAKPLALGNWIAMCHMAPISRQQSPLCTLSIPLPFCSDSKSAWVQRCYWFHLSSHFNNLGTVDSDRHTNQGNSFTESLMQGIRWEAVASHYTAQSRGVMHKLWNSS